NAKDVFPEKLLRQIQKYVSGETIYIPAGVEKKDWGETSGYQQYIRERNAAIRDAFRDGKAIEALMEEYSLSYDTIKRIVYSKKEVTMLKYSATLDSALEYGREEKMDAWVHLYLNEEGRNIPFSDGLKLFDRYFISPAQFPISLFHRCAGPEEDMKYRIDKGWWEHKITELTKAVKAGAEMPPMIIHYVDGEFELNDGNHRHKVYEDLGIETAWVILWITEEAELTDFMSKYGEYVKDCTIIRR
ncbi:MAG: ParB N-terminal domain-containing protein, partial [Lachnospiraceae bacterium]|nr:ParB N-terminal domain-containing protein [Lachnospiraceae bacterium]